MKWLDFLFFWRRKEIIERKTKNNGPFRTAAATNFTEPPVAQKSKWQVRFENIKKELEGHMGIRIGEGIKFFLVVATIVSAISIFVYGANYISERRQKSSLEEMNYRKEHNLPPKIEKPDEPDYDEFTINCYHAGKQILSVEVYGMPLFDKNNQRQLVCINEQCGHCVTTKGHSFKNEHGDSIRPERTVDK